MADNKKYLQTQVFKLAGGGISFSDTSINLQSFKLPNGEAITTDMIGTSCTGTLEPGTKKEEIISFTGVTQNGDGTATLTGVTRGLKFKYPYDSDASLKFSHAGSTSFIVTNNPQMYDGFANKNNDETITGDWQVPIPAGDNSITPKKFVTDLFTGVVGFASNTLFGTTKTTKNQGSKSRVKSILVREQATPDKTLYVESFKFNSIDTQINYVGGNTPNFIDPGLAGDLSIALNPANGETITITVDGTDCVFTFVTTIGTTAGNILIGASAAATRANLVALINAPSVTTANGVAFSGAQLTAIQKLSATDDTTLNAFIRVINTSTTTFSVTETMAGAGNIWTVNTTKNRYDLVVVDSSSTLQIRKGVEAVSPVIPTLTSGDIVLASVFNKCGQTLIRETSTDAGSTNGYINEWYELGVYRTDIPSSDYINSLLNREFYFGNGSDGDVVISTNTTLIRDMFYNNLTINTGITLYPNGYRIFVKNNLTVSGTGKINRSGNNGANGAVSMGVGSDNALGGAALPSGTLPGVAAGGVGGNVNQGNLQQNGSPAANVTNSIGVVGGAGGGPRPTGTVTAASPNINAPYSVYILDTTAITMKNSTGLFNGSSSGAGGDSSAGNGGTRGGGGGGSSGGIIFISAKNINFSANNSVTAIGGNGGNGAVSGLGNSYGGGGGSGGVIVLIYKNMLGTLLSASSALAGGTGGTTGGVASGSNGNIGNIYSYQIT